MKLEDYFTLPDFAIPRRLIASVEGIEKVGKSTFSLSALSEGDVAYMNWDMGEEGVIHKFKDSPNKLYQMKLIPPGSLALEKGKSKDQYKEAWELSKAAYYAALESTAPTVVLDTGTEWYESARLAFHGRLDKVLARDYGIVYAELRKMVRDAFETKKNVIYIHKLKDEYINDKRTGNQEFSGFKDIPFLVQARVQCFYTAGEFGIRILDSRHRPELKGMGLKGALCSFSTLLSIIHDS
jgi:hypothetical protein